jgi:hypothetical protein
VSTRSVDGRAQESQWMPFKESYEDLEMSRNAAFASLQRGDYPVPVVRFGGRWRVSRQAHRQFVASCQAAS